MPFSMTRGLALASIATLPLTLGTAWGQTETETEAEATPVERESSTEMDIGTETELQQDAPMSSGPKRVKVPSAGDAATSEDSMQTEDVTVQQSGSGAEAEETQAAQEPAEEAGEAGAAAAPPETGVGPFVGDYTIGDPAAPVQVVEYASFTCPHCAAYHQEAWEGLKADFIDPGRIGFTLREVYFDRFGLWASMAARCGGERAFYPIADQFLAKQAEWTKAEDIAQAIAGIARLNGLTDAQIKACLENQDFAKMLVEDYKANQEADEVTSTPTFLVISPDGTERIVGNKPDEVREAIEAGLPAG
ncbi:MAG TPA: DsbA family protein [Thermohalobaculum sp.]|nr:DsbA family protein [Thermohalobaculum sp.]